MAAGIMPRPLDRRSNITAEDQEEHKSQVEQEDMKQPLQCYIPPIREHLDKEEEIPQSQLEIKLEEVVVGMEEVPDLSSQEQYHL
jgi:hypothetical protein